MVGVGLAWVACGSVSCQQSVVKSTYAWVPAQPLVCVCDWASSSTLLSLSFPIYKWEGNASLPPHVC